MIQPNKTFFQFTKRFALVVILAILSNVVFANGNSSSYFYDLVQATHNIEAPAEGLVYITANTPVEEGQEIPYSATVFKATVQSLSMSGNESDVTNVPVYLYANTTGVNNALWIGWFDYQGNIIDGGKSDAMVNVKPTTKDTVPQTPKPQFIYTATWLQPIVTGQEKTLNLGTIKSKEIDAVTPATDTYTIENYSLAEHFKIESPTNDYFTVTLTNVTEVTKITNGKTSGTATVSVNYTPQGIHGEHSGTSYLTSALYTQGFGTANDFFKPIHYKIYEDYTPSFEVEHSTGNNAYNLGTTNVGNTISSALLNEEVKNKNYAASARVLTNDVQKQNTTTWNAEITSAYVSDGSPSEAYKALFSIIEGKNTPTPTIQFNADNQILQIDQQSQKTIIAELTLSCTYNDESNPSQQVGPTSKKVYVSVTAIQSNEATLQFGSELGKPQTTHNFEDQPIGSDVSVLIPITTINVKDISEPILSNNLFVARKEGNNLRININNDEVTSCGEITTTITLNGTSTLGDNALETCSLTVYANMYLLAPVVTAVGGNGNVTFKWNPVPGATEYRAYASQNAQQYETITGTSLTKSVGNEQSLTYWFKAANNDGCESVMTSATGKAELDIIDKDNADATGLQTGTKTAGTGFPWREVRDIDVTSAFDNEGNPIFDELHIFALTAGDKATNLSTPCLKYVKEGNHYKKDVSFNETKGSTSKDAIYTFTIPNKTNKKIYITGYRPYAVTGDKSAEGVMYFEGSSDAILDIYLENCEIIAQSKKNETISISSIPTSTYFGRGSGSVFVFRSTSESTEHPFNVNIHARGYNTLDAVRGTNIEVDIRNDDKQLISDNSITNSSSPISVFPAKEQQVVKLTIDDIWEANGHTNGELHIEGTYNSATNNTSKASIDLGYSTTQLSVNGGQIYFQTNAALYQMSSYTYTKDDQSVTMAAYGFEGTSTTLKDAATITLMDGSINGSTPKFYATNFTIEGGTYNTNVEHYKNSTKQTTLYNSDGKILKKFLVDNTDNRYWEETNGIADITESFPMLIDDLFPEAGVTSTYELSGEANSYHYKLSSYYVGGKMYGHASLTPKDNKLNLFLPELDCESVKHAWQICAPDFYIDIEKLGRTYSIGGGENVINACPIEGHNEPYTTDYFLYMEGDEYIFAENENPNENVLGNEFFAPKRHGYGQIIIAAKNKDLYSSISDATPYTINKKVYMLMPVEAAKWTLFTPPFDVANVYVIESYPENQLIKDHGGKRGKIPATSVKAARAAQASRMMDLYAIWYFEGKGMGTPSDFFGNGTTDLDNDGTADKYGQFISEWINYETNTNYKQVADGDYTPVIEKLIHFTGKDGNYPEGKNWLDANYYLYKSKGDWQFVNNQYIAEWDTVRTVANGTDAIMEKGQVYAIQFPYNSINGTHDPTTTWDYWTGKYLLIESTVGPHTINGSNFVTSALSAQNVVAGTASLFGNSTFAEITATLPTNAGANTTMWALEKKSASEAGTTRDIHEMVQQTNTTLAPTSGVLLANFQAPQGTIAKSINYTTGEITYEKIDDPNTGDIETGLPTITGDLTLLVESTPEGLCITPIKEQHVMLFDADGKMLFSKYLTAEENVTLPTGVYVVRGEYEQVKAIKK